MAADARSLLTANLWDLRAQVEAQLRCLTKVQRWADEFPSLSPGGRQWRKEEIAQNLREIRTTAETVADVAEAAISNTDAL